MMSEKAAVKCLLIVEDDDGIRASIVRWAALIGVRTVSYPSVEACIQGLRHAEFSLCNEAHSINVTHAIVDITLPGRNGFELLSELSPPLAEERIIFMTARLHEFPVQSGDPQNGPNILRKPFELSELERCIGL